MAGGAWWRGGARGFVLFVPSYSLLVHLHSNGVSG